MADQEVQLYPALSNVHQMIVPQGTRALACPRGCGQRVIMAPDGTTPLEVDPHRSPPPGKLAVRFHLGYCRANRNDRRRAQR